MTVRIERWSVCEAKSDPFMAPELRWQALQGRVYGHHRKADGERIVTSRIVEVKGRHVVTASGTVYELGWPHPAYVKWIREQGYRYDAAQPIGVGRDSRRSS